MILVDTGPVVALCDDADRLHGRALRELKRLRREVRAVSVPVLVEAHFLLRADHLRLRLRALLDNGILEAREPSDAATCLRYCLDWLHAYDEHDPDFTDAWLVALAHQTGAPVWTFDGEFATTWRMLDGGPISRSPTRGAAPVGR